MSIQCLARLLQLSVLYYWCVCSVHVWYLISGACLLIEGADGLLLLNKISVAYLGIGSPDIGTSLMRGPRLPPALIIVVSCLLLIGSGVLNNC